MSIKEVTYYQGVCDWPGGCDAELHYEYTAWGDPSSVLDEVRDADWWQSKEDEKTFYCNNHPAVWASDEDNRIGAIPPYLLIHDGDTDNHIDDGTVTLITAASDHTEVEVVDLVAALRASIEAAKERRAAKERGVSGDPR